MGPLSEPSAAEQADKAEAGSGKHSCGGGEAAAPVEPLVDGRELPLSVSVSRASRLHRMESQPRFASLRYQLAHQLEEPTGARPWPRAAQLPPAAVPPCPSPAPAPFGLDTAQWELGPTTCSSPAGDWKTAAWLVGTTTAGPPLLSLSFAVGRGPWPASEAACLGMPAGGSCLTTASVQEVWSPCNNRPSCCQ